MSDNSNNNNDKEGTSFLGTALAVIGVVGAIAGLFSGMGSGPNKKTMKAPGKDGESQIYGGVQTNPLGEVQPTDRLSPGINASFTITAVTTTVVTVGAVTKACVYRFQVGRGGGDIGFGNHLGAYERYMLK
ncbi:unnamed protein product [Arabidopsis lyrata]|nr:unnamed protein product [Arabidopsis lyrata]